jgi:hypothetical protein
VKKRGEKKEKKNVGNEKKKDGNMIDSRCYKLSFSYPK